MNIIYRSSWERIFCNWCDKTDSVISWQSEEKALWYYDPIAQKKRRYFPDFIIKYENKEGVVITEMIEIKPKRQVDGPPQKPKSCQSFRRKAPGSSRKWLYRPTVGSKRIS